MALTEQEIKQAQDLMLTSQNPLPTAREIAPDAASRAVKVHRATGIDDQIYVRNLSLVDDHNDQERWDRIVATSPRTARFLAEKQTNAAMGRDDAENLQKIEGDFNLALAGGWAAKGKIGGAPFQRSAGGSVSGRIGDAPYVAPAGEVLPATGPKAGVISALRGIGAAFTEGGIQTRAGIREQAADALAGTDIAGLVEQQNQVRAQFGIPAVKPGLSAVIAAQRESAQSRFRLALATPEFESDLGRGLYSGLQSTAQQFPGLAATLITRMPAFGLASAGIQTEASAYSKYRARGATPSQALLGGGLEGGIEVATEMIPMGTLLASFGKSGKNAALGVVKSQLQEQFGEQVATALQDAVDTAIANPNKTWGEYLAERPSAAYQTALATLAQSGVMLVAHKAASTILAPYQQKAAEGESAAVFLESIDKLSQASKVRNLDTTTFENFVADVAAGSPAENLYIDGKVLNQSGIALDLARFAPELADDIQVAIESGGTLRIPTATFAGRISGTEISQTVLENARTDPLGFSKVEAQDFYANQAEIMQAEIQRAANMQSVTDEFTAGQRAVQDTIKSQLDAVGRFTPEANELYSLLIGSRVATRARQLGISPEQMFAESPLGVVNQKMLFDAARKKLASAGIAHDIREKNGVISLGKITAADVDMESADVVDAIKDLNDYALMTGQRLEVGGLEQDGPDNQKFIEAYNKFIAARKQRSSALNQQFTMDDLLSSFDPDMVEEIELTDTQGETDETRFLSPFKARGAFTITGEESPLLGRIRSASAQATNELGGEVATARQVDEILGPFSGYGVDAEVNADGNLQVNVFGKEQIDAGLTDEPALLFVVTPEGELSVNGPTGETFDEFAKRGWADVAKGKDGEVQLGWTSLVNPDGKPIPTKQLINLLADVHARARLWKGSPEKIGLYWTRQTGATGGLFGRETAAFFQSDVIPATITIDGKERSTTNSNGKQIAQTEEGVRNFWKWFGDSKVVDADGRPLVVYHGTTVDFNLFRDNSRGVHFVSPSKTWISKFNTNEDGTVAEGANVMAVYVKADNAFDFENKKHVNNLAMEASLGSAAISQIRKGSWSRLEDRTTLSAIKRLGFDGLYVSEDGIKNLAAFSSSQIKSATGNRGTFDPANANILNQDGTSSKRGAFIPDQDIIALLEKADLSTFLHEAAHWFYETDIAMASKFVQQETRTPGEQEIVDDVSTLLNWHGIIGTPQQQLDQWYSMSFEEQRAMHERTAETFEAYLYTGKAPTIELQKAFNTFRQWLLNVYRSLKDFLASRNREMTDEVRGVFDRMLATQEQIDMANAARSMVDLIETADQVGMSQDEFAAYQAPGAQATAEAASELESRSLRDTKFQANARSKEIKKLKAEQKELRDEITMQVRGEVMSMPIYRAWSFLTGRIREQDKIPKAEKSPRDSVDPKQDSLFAAISKLGGLNRDEVKSEWGITDKIATTVFGKPVLRKSAGLSVDEMARALGELGYLSQDRNGKTDVRELEEKFISENSGDQQYSVLYVVPEDARPVDDMGGGRFGEGELLAMGLPAGDVRLAVERKMVSKAGFNPDFIAELFGYDSGAQLISELADVDAPAYTIEKIVDARMLMNHGDLATDEAIEDAADKAIMNKVRARHVITEHNALAKATGGARILEKAAAELADKIISAKKVRDIQPKEFTAAAAKAAVSAKKAMNAGDLKQAAEDSRARVIQTVTAKAAYDAKEAVDVGVKYLRKMAYGTTRKNLGAEYLEQIDAMLAGADLTIESRASLDRKKDFATYVESQIAQGKVPLMSDAVLSKPARAAYLAKISARDVNGELVFPDEDRQAQILAEAIDNDRSVSWQDMTFEQFSGLIDNVKNIEHAARMQNRLLTAGEANYQARRDEMNASLIANAKNAGKNTGEASGAIAKAIESVKKFGAAHIKAATQIRIFDGGNLGIWWDTLIRPANEAQTKETNLKIEVVTSLNEILSPILAKVSVMDKIGKGKFFPSIGKSLNWEQRFSVAANYGNESNLQRLKGGGIAGGPVELTDAQVQDVLRSLSKEEWLAVQSVWDEFEKLRPLSAEVEIRMNGKEPKWIEPRPFTVRTSDGETLTLRGGYFPVRFDKAATGRADTFSRKNEAKDLLSAAGGVATTRKSFTVERVQEVHNMPLALNMTGMYNGFNEVVHHIAWAEWAADAGKLLRSKTLDASIREHYGAQVKQELQRWFDVVVVGERSTGNQAELFANFMRRNISASALSFNMMTGVTQVFGLAQTAQRIGIKWAATGVAKYISAPLEYADMVQEKSEFMGNRTRTMNRELNEIKNMIEGESKLKELQGKYGFALVSFFQYRMVDLPTWIGAYEKAVAEGNITVDESGVVDDSKAVAMADQVVKDSQGGGEIMDQAGVVRGNAFVKLFTVFYEFMNTSLNLQYGTAKTKPKLEAAMTIFITVAMVPVLQKMLKDLFVPGDSDDWEDLESAIRTMLKESLGNIIGMIMLGREFSIVLDKALGTGGGLSYKGPAGLRLVSDSSDLVTQATQGDADMALMRSSINVMGDLFGLPSVQINKTIKGMDALEQGKTDNPAALVFGYQGKGK